MQMLGHDVITREELDSELELEVSAIYLHLENQVALLNRQIKRERGIYLGVAVALLIHLIFG